MITYAEVRDTIKSGDLLAFSSNDWSTWHGIKVQLIRIFTRSEYDHVGVAWVTGGRVFVLEAVMPMTRIFPLSLSGPFYLIEMNAPWKKMTEDYALSHIGYEYSQLAAMRSFLKPVEIDQVNECAAYAIQVMLHDDISLGVMATPSKVVQAALELGKHVHFIEN
jgi:hypothetical protein